MYEVVDSGFEGETNPNGYWVGQFEVSPCIDLTNTEAEDVTSLSALMVF